MYHPITLTSFGFLHLDGNPLLEAERIENVRRRFRDPAAAKGLLDLDGTDPRVQRAVLTQPGVNDFIDNLVAYAESFSAEEPCRIAIGCSGGKHRAVALTNFLADRLRQRHHEVTVTHLHKHLPRVLTNALTTKELAS